MIRVKVMSIAVLSSVISVFAADECCSGERHAHQDAGVAKLLGNCFWSADGGGISSAQESNNGGNKHASGHEIVEVSENALASMHLSTVLPEKRRIRSTVTMLGRMELASDARSMASAPIAGRISLKVRELDRVKPGDVLFTVDSPVIKSLSHEIEVLESRLQVYRRLKTANAEIESSLKVKKSEKAALLAGADEVDGVVAVRSARAAMVERLNLIGGAWADTGASVVTLVCPRMLRFRAQVSSSEAARLHDGMKVSVSGSEAELRLGVGEGGMVPVYALFHSAGAPGRAGDRVRAECVLKSNEVPVWALPDDCIVAVGAESVVFMRDRHRKTRFFAVSVRTGMSGGGWTAVEGLSDTGAEVVKTGVYGLKLALAAKSASDKPVGHFHADGSFHEGDEH